MFKNATLARVSGLTSAGDLGAVARLAAFAPTGPTQIRSIGFVPPREANGTMVESVGGQWILAVQIETRSVPADQIAKLVALRVKQIEDETGRKPGKAVRRVQKEEALLELLPHAFPKSARIPVWIDPAAGLCVIDSASSGKTDAVATLLAQALGLTVSALRTGVSPAAWMRDMIVGLPEGAGFDFDLGDECELRSPDTRATVRYANMLVNAPDVQQHVEQGKEVRRLGLEWDGRVDFVLADDGTLRKIVLDVSPGDGVPADEFDANVMIGTGMLRPLLVDLIAALGGEVQP